MGRDGLLARRTFLKRASALALAGPALDLGLLGMLGCSSRPQLATAAADADAADVSWRTTIVSDKEAGEPLIVSGTIYTPDGSKPLPGINLYVYQTDATGVYTTSGGDNRKTRIHGLMRTNEAGRYEFRTIKPVSYPNSRIPAHIHAYVSGPGYPEYWIDEYWFNDDPFVAAEQKQKAAAQEAFSPILTLTRGADGFLRGVRDIRIERCSRNCT
jgi:protocatechuate 3,4-dioxygenase beta subunit